MVWEQKVARFYDPDKHLIQVGEELAFMVRRLRNNGMSINELAEKTFIKKNVIEEILKEEL